MKTLIAVPCMDTMPTQFVKSFLDLDKPEGTRYVILPNTLIYTARNIIAQEAIDGGFDRVLWLDSDMIVPEDTLTRLSEDLDTGKEIVTGLYFSRRFPVFPVIFSKLEWYLDAENGANIEHQRFIDYPEDQLFEVAAAGFGCIMTSVDLLKKMVDRYSVPFTPLMGIGEDMSFCWRVRLEGIPIYCDSRIKCGHVGQAIFDESVFKNAKKQPNSIR